MGPDTRRHFLRAMMSASLLCLSHCADDARSEPAGAKVVPLTTKVAGKSYAEWGVEWFKDIMAIPLPQSIPSDATGANCGNGQPAADVWFLAGTWGTAAVTRTCTVPAGRHLFFPIVNYLNDYPCPDASFKPADGQSLGDFLAAGAKAQIDATTELEVEVDGEALSGLRDLRAAAGLFDFTADVSYQAIDGCITGTEQQGAADGYWVMLEPLPAGDHTIHLRGKEVFGDGNTFTAEASYNLHVAK